MKKQFNKKKALILGLTAVTAIGVTFALYVSKFSVDNEFQVNAPNAKFVENFMAPGADETIFGSSYEKYGYVDNTDTGSVDVKARAKITAYWVDKDGNKEGDAGSAAPNNKFDTDKNAATLDFGDTAYLGDFANAGGNNYVTANGVASTTNNIWKYATTDASPDVSSKYYFYYNGIDGIIAKGTSSNRLLKQVSFSADLGQTIVTSIYTVEGDEKIGLEATDPTGYDSQADAVARVAKLREAGKSVSGRITFTQTSEYIKSANDNSYDKAKYIVKIEGQIVSADTKWSDVAPL